MLTWQDGYRIGEGVKKAEKVKSRLDAGKFVQGIYLLTLSENPANIMDVTLLLCCCRRAFTGSVLLLSEWQGTRRKRWKW